MPPTATLHRVIDGIEVKLCRKCQRWLILDNFNSAKKAWDSLHTKCKTCVADYYREKRKKLETDGRVSLRAEITGYTKTSQ